MARRCDEPKQVILAGNLSEEPVPGARKHDVCTFVLAFQGPFAADRGAAARSRDFVPVIAFGRTAEACLRFLKKGSRVVVDGRLRDDRWRSQSGSGTSRIAIVCDRIHFVSGLKREEPPGVAAPLGSPHVASAPASVSPSGRQSSHVDGLAPRQRTDHHE